MGKKILYIIYIYYIIYNIIFLLRDNVLYHTRKKKKHEIIIAKLRKLHQSAHDVILSLLLSENKTRTERRQCAPE